MIMKNNRNSNKKKGAFLLRPVQVQNGRKNRLTAFLTDVCFVWLYLAGMTFWLESSLQLDISIGICLLAALAGRPCFSSWQPVDGQRMVPEDDGLEF